MASEAAAMGGRAAVRPLLVSAHQAATILSIGRTTLYELIKLDMLTPVHIGRCVRFSVVELERYVDGLLRMNETVDASSPPSPCTAPERTPIRRTPDSHSYSGLQTLF